MTQPTNTKRAYSTTEAADYTGISTTHLEHARLGKRKNRLDAPQHTKLGGKRVVYLKEDLDAWLDAHRAATQAVAAA